MKLDLRLIIPGPTPSTVLLAADGGLPARLVDHDQHDASIVAASAMLRDQLGFRTPVLETHPRWEGVPDGEPVPTLVTTEPAPPDWTPPDGLAFEPIPSAIDGLPALLAPRAAEMLAEIRTGAAPPALRPRWARRGWHVRATTWMTEALAAIGRPLIEEPRPFYLRGISALLRGRTAGGDVFLKAVFPPFHAEPVVTRLLASRAPDAVPRVLAIEADEGWLIVEDLASPWIGELPDRPAALAVGARAIVAVQQVLANDLEPFVEAGCPARSLAGIAAALDGTLAPEGVVHGAAAITSKRRRRAVVATRAAADRVAGLGFPTTVVHGDFHAGNAALVNGRAVIIDWSDAAIGNPLVDLVTWLSWSKDYPDDRRVATDAWIEAWTGPTDPAAVRERIDDILLVGAAYQVISYEGILRALEPATRYTMADEAVLYLDQLESIVATSV